MKKNYWLALLSLLVSLFIYLFYRTENTVVNQLFISLASWDTFFYLRLGIIKNLSLNQHIIYSLPEGLWVFCITLTSKLFFIKADHYKINLLFLPLFFSIGLEVLQLFQLTNGRFDWWDIGVSAAFWAVAAFGIKSYGTKQNIMAPFIMESFICLLSYGIVYLAHVWK